MEAATIEASQFRAVMANYPTGVAVITAMGADGQPIGMVVGSFTSISLEPFLVGYFPSKGSTTFAALRDRTTFAINVLSSDQEPLCRRFAARTADKFAGVDWRPGPNGAPLLDGAIAWIECELESITDVGDHHLTVGRPTFLQVGAPGLPLLFFQGAYGKYSAHPLPTGFDSDPWSVVRRIARSRVLLETLATETGAEVSVVVGSRNDLWVAAATDGAISVHEGARIPMISPVASILVAQGDVGQVSAWLEPYEVSNEVERREAMVRLRRAHARGYSVALEETDVEAKLSEGWNAYSSDLRTPNQERHYRRLYDAMAHLYDPSDEELAGLVRLRSLTVPIGDVGEETVGLRLSAFGEPIDAAQIPGLARRMQAAAREIEECSAIGRCA